MDVSTNYRKQLPYEFCSDLTAEPGLSGSFLLYGFFRYEVKTLREDVYAAPEKVCC